MPRTLRSRRGRRRWAAFDHGQPIWRPSLAPLAAVWLIGATLLMGVYVNPPHAVLIDFSPPIPEPLLPEPALQVQVLRIGVDPDGTPTFNAVRVTMRDLALMLDVAAHFEWTPGVIFEAHPRARYGDALPVLGAIKKVGLGDWRFCFGGLADHRRFEKDWRYTPLRLTLLPPPELPPPLERPVAPGDCDPRRRLPPLRPMPVLVNPR